MKRGIIKIHNDLYISKWSEIYVFMKDFRLEHLEFRHWENDVWYLHGISDSFDNVNVGCVIPFYTVEFNTEEGKDITFRFIKES